MLDYVEHCHDVKVAVAHIRECAGLNVETLLVPARRGKGRNLYALRTKAHAVRYRDKKSCRGPHIKQSACGAKFLNAAHILLKHRNHRLFIFVIVDISMAALGPG